MSDVNPDDAQRQLQGYLDTVRQLIARGIAADTADFRDRVDELKKTIEHEYLQRSATRALAKHSIVDASDLLPAIQDVYSALRTIRNDGESSARRLTALLGAEIELGRWMAELESTKVIRQFIGIAGNNIENHGANKPTFLATFRVHEHGKIRFDSYSEAALEAIITLAEADAEDTSDLSNALRKLRRANATGLTG